MQTDSNLIILDSGVDWLTVTAKRGDTSDRLIALGKALLHQSESQGNRVSGFSSMGYKGWRTQGVTYGRRKDGSIVSLSSGEAALNWLPVAEASDHVTRLDLQITCFDQTQDAHRAEAYYYALQASNKRRGRPLSSSLRLNSGGGDTLYLGSPKSDIIGRFYDKGREQKIAAAGACWRYETQHRRESAEGTLGVIRQSETLHDTIAALVANFFTLRGVAVPEVERTLSAHELHSTRYYLQKRETDDARSLRWLSTFVAGTVKRLVDSGQRGAVMRALGLEDAGDTPDR